MTQSGKKMLDGGDAFPNMSLNLTGGAAIDLLEEVKGSWTIFLVYRGHW